MLSTHDLANKIRTIVLERLSIDIPADDVDLIETGVLDSLVLVDLILNLEKEFSLNIPLESIDLESFRSVGSIAGLIATIHSAQAGATAKTIPT